jgi:4-hydroxyphenylpyruvate dioxygenase
MRILIIPLGMDEYIRPWMSRWLCCARPLQRLRRRVPSDSIFFVQLGDAELVDPEVFRPPEDPEVPRLLPWSREHRLYPIESERGGYMPVELVAAAVLATGYQGPLSLEVFNKSLASHDSSVPPHHAERGYTGLQNLMQAVKQVPRFWDRNVRSIDKSGPEFS